jgi:MoaA/NifB/PqqE/SkfB family radical SAM enzyme
MEDRMKLVDIIRYAHEKNVLLISPHFHNMSAAIPHTYQLYMVRIPADMKGRSCVHKNCLAPWRIAVVSVDGVLSPCNCAPEVLLGNIQTEQVTVLWNGPAMKQWRRDMKSHPSDLCRCCPRF